MSALLKGLDVHRRLLALVLLSWLAGCTADLPGQCKLAHVTDLPLLPPGEVLLTPAFLNDQPTTMMLDTGSEMTLIARPSAQRLHLSLRETGGWISGVGGRQDLYAFTAHSFRIGQLQGTHLILAASNIGIDPQHTRLDGILGADFLGGYDIDLDLPERKLRLFKVVAGCTTPASNLEEPIYLAPLVAPDSGFDRRPHVVVTIGGVRLNALVDSGAQRSAIFRNSARRLGLRLADLTADRHGRALGIGPRARDEVQHIMAPIAIGEITISNLPVSIVDERSDGDADMLLGLDFLSRVHVWLSFASRTMMMQYPPRPSPALHDE